MQIDTDSLLESTVHLTARSSRSGALFVMKRSTESGETMFTVLPPSLIHLSSIDVGT